MQPEGPLEAERKKKKKTSWFGYNPTGIRRSFNVVGPDNIKNVSLQWNILESLCMVVLK